MIELVFRHCPRCRKKPVNLAGVGYKFGCPCRIAMVQAKFSFFTDVAADSWNELARKELEIKMQESKDCWEEDDG
jgi:hypothetical protein